jgi:hypothetical protein
MTHNVFERGKSASQTSIEIKTEFASQTRKEIATIIAKLEETKGNKVN